MKRVLKSKRLYAAHHKVTAYGTYEGGCYNQGCYPNTCKTNPC